MAAPVPVAGSSPALCPSFAVVCSFLERYGAALDLPELSFPQFERYLRETSTVPKPLVELHVRLLRKIGKSATPDRWEKFLIKICQDFNCTWAWELERKGYSEMSMESKAGILKYLCECQFDDNIKFKTSVNEEEPDQMRLHPIGRDKEGLIYWFQVDQDQNVRVYVEEQDDSDGATWKCIVTNRNDLAKTVDDLKAQIGLGQIEEGHPNSSTCPSPLPDKADKEDIKKEIQIEDICSEKKLERREKVSPGVSKESKGQTEQTKKLKSCDEKDEENIEMEMKVINKTELKAEEKTVIDNRVSTIKSLVKEESKDSEVAWNAVSVVMGPCSVKLDASTKTETLEDTSEKTLEEVERAIKSDQQAKIPLKKRELKLGEGFGNNVNNNSNRHSNNSRLINNSTLSSGIIVRNPSVLIPKVPWPSREEPLNSEEGQTVVSSSCSDSTSTPTKREPKPDLCNGEINSGRSTSQNLGKHCMSVIMGPMDRKNTSVEQSIPVYGNCIRTISSCYKEGQEDGAHDERIPSPGTMRQSVLVTKATVPESTTPVEPKNCEAKAHENDLGAVEGNKEDPVKDKAKTVEDNDNSSRAFSKDSESSGDNRSEPGGTEEVSSEIQKEGIRLKIKIPMHRRTPEFQKEKEREQQEASDGHSLRRSARICRPSPKLAEIQDRRQEKKHAGSCAIQEDKELRDNEVKKASQKKDSPQKVETELPNKLGKVRRRHRRPRWSNQRSKGRKKAPGEGEEALGDGEGREGGETAHLPAREKGHNESDTARSLEMPNDDPCTHCGLPNHPELILLCDLCDSGYHTACLRPPIMIIPEGQWFCPPCQHKLLCERLEEQLQVLDAALKKKERAERRRERLVYVGISVENIIPTPDGDAEVEKMEKKKNAKKNKNLERRSTRTRKSISYRFDDFDEAIDEAIEEDIRETDSQASAQAKDIASISRRPKLEEGKPSQPRAKPSPAPRRKKRRRLNDLDSDSTVDEEESEDDFRLSSSTEEEDFVVSGDEAGSEGDAGSNDCSDWGSTASRPQQRRSRRAVSRDRDQRARTGAKTRGRRGRKSLSRHRGCLSDEDEEEELETEEEEEEEDMETEGSSDFSDSDVDTQRRRSRRSQCLQVNYCETSESEGGRKPGKNQDKPQPHRRRLCSSNSEGSEDESENKKRRRKDRKSESLLMDSRRARLKRRRRHSTDEDRSGGSDSEDESEDERPVRKRLNRIESEDEDGEDVEDRRLQGEEEEDDEEEEENGEEDEEEEPEVKKTARLLTGTDMLSANRSSRVIVARRHEGDCSPLAPRDNGPCRTNGLASLRPCTQDDEDDFDGVTDIVHLVFKGEQAL